MGQSPTESSSHTSSWGMTTLRMKINSTFTSAEGCRSNCPLVFRNARTNETVNGILGVLHFSWASHWFYFFVDPTITNATVIHDTFSAGDEIVIERAELPYLSREDNIGVSFVYGVDRDCLDRPSRLRIGSTSQTRDYTVYTINRLLDINPGWTYVDRQYVVTGPLSFLDDESRNLKNHSAQRVILPNGSFESESSLSLYRDGVSFAVCDLSLIHI